MQLDDFIRPCPPDERLTVAVAMATDRDLVACVGRALRDMARFILIGPKKEILRVADEQGVDLGGAEFLHAETEQEACHAAARLAAGNRAQVMMKGLVQTATFTRAILDKEHGLLEKDALISHVAVFELPRYHKLLIITDAGIAICPGVEEKVRILRNAISIAGKIGVPLPKVALVAPLEKVNSHIQSTVDAARLAEIASSGGFPGALVQGPFGFDIAVSREAARVKGVRSSVAGDPDILLLPGLDAANAAYKALTSFAGARVAGVLAGVRVPVVVTSRADSEETKLASLGLALHIGKSTANVV